MSRGDPDDERATLYTEAFQTCRDRLVNTGVNPRAYTPAASAADSIDLVSTLGYEKVNLYGVSYGTRLSLTIMHDHPEIVRSAVLDSVLPLETKLYNDITARTDHSLKVLFASCAADPTCNAAYPNLERAFYGLVTQLDAEQVTVEISDPFTGITYDFKVNGSQLINAIVLGLNSTYLIPVLPKTIYDMREGDYSYLSTALALPVTWCRAISFGVHASINCHEHVHATTPEELEADLGAYPKLAAYGRYAVYGSAEALFSICETWGAAPFDSRIRESLASEIPTLILAGEYDPSTLLTYSKQVANDLPNSHIVEFPGWGHAASTSAPVDCPLNVVFSFLGDPTTSPDTACIADLEGSNFIVPSTSVTGGQSISLSTLSTR